MTKEELEYALAEHADMWGKDKDHYMLMPPDKEINDALQYGIVDLRNNHGVLIENSELARGVIQRMLAAGVQIGNPFDPRVKKELIRRRLNMAKGSDS